ncbi:MAG: Gfo/Idh/MocA family oxidoreductase [Clostridiaceae bacterium]|nr:Gfo/Idh/MocA family oxidoreductase [Clostridiaceae bacterium]
MIVGIIGGGNGGHAILGALKKMEEVKVAGIVDINNNAPGIQLAKQLGIFCSDSIEELFNKNLDIVIEATGNNRVQQDIEKYNRKDVKVVCSEVAELMMGLVGNETKVLEKLEGQVEEIKNLGKVTENSIEKMHKSIENTNDLSETLNIFAQNTIGLVKETDQILRVMNKITQQTNILGLNASIEAARAGEQGRGFAVVAQEVQKLAQNSEGFTKQIDATLSTINQEVNSVAEKIQELEKVAHDQKEVGKDLEEAISNLLNNTKNM